MTTIVLTDFFFKLFNHSNDVERSRTLSSLETEVSDYILAVNKPKLNPDVFLQPDIAIILSAFYETALYEACQYVKRVSYTFYTVDFGGFDQIFGDFQQV